METKTSGGSAPSAELSGPPIPSAEEVYRDVAPLLRRIAVRKFGVPPNDADGLVHDVFITYLARPTNVRGDLRGYLIGSICNASRYYWRSKKSEERVFSRDEALDDAPGTSEDIFEGLAQNLMVSAVLSRLSPRCREALRRYYMDGDTTSAIATALQTSSGNVNYVMFVCRKRARDLCREMSGKPTCP